MQRVKRASQSRKRFSYFRARGVYFSFNDLFSFPCVFTFGLLTLNVTIFLQAVKGEVRDLLPLLLLLCI